jgi:hypothetical protein
VTTYNSNNDLPTSVDLSLGTTHFVDKLAIDIQNAKPPKTFSITGYWGSGKTSALAMLYKKLTNDDPLSPLEGASAQSTDCIGIWFEAWKYQHEPLPIVALLQEIKSSFSTSNKFINAAGKLASVSFLGALTVLDGVIKTVTGASGLGKVKAIGESYEKENLLERLSSDQINDALKQAVDTLISNDDDKKKLVIFIDDLDRCEPEMALTLLEGLKLYLSIPNCVVVMAIDSQQIENKILKQIDCYNRFQGVEYMEKLCQDAHRLPVPNAQQRNAFLVNSLRPLLSDLNTNQLTIINDLSSSIEGFDCLPANPRRLKMLANRVASIFRYVSVCDIGTLTSFCEENNISNNHRDELFALGVLIVSSLSVNYRRLYERLEKSSLFFEELFEFCNSPNYELYEEKQSVFYEFQRVDISSRKVIEHPSDLAVFKLACLFEESTDSVINKYSINKVFYGDMLNQVITSYNTPKT